MNWDLIRKWLPSDMRLAEQYVADHHKEWFSQTRIDVIEWFSLRKFHLCCALILIIVTWNFVPSWISFCYALGGLSNIISPYQIHRLMGKTKIVNKNQLLVHLVIRTIISAIAWGIMIGSAIALSTTAISTFLVSFGLYVMMVTTLSCFSIPFVGIVNSAIILFGLAVGYFFIYSFDFLFVVVVLVLAGHTLYPINFNIYYMFATRRLRTRVLREANETVSLLLNDYDQQASDWLWQIDTCGEIVNPSSRFVEATGLSNKEMLALYFYDLFRDGVELHTLKSYFDAKHPFRDIVIPVLVNNEIRWWSISGKPLYTTADEFIGFRGFSTDITTSKLAEDKVSFLAQYDSLTNLPNRSLFRDSLFDALFRREASDTVALMYIDLDNFKSVNDAHGHTGGDAALVAVARHIEEVCGSKGMVARFGGDEFAVFLPRVKNPEDAVNVAKSIVAKLAMEFTEGTETVKIGASVGIAFAPDHAAEVDILLQRADIALYDAKTRGGERCSIFDASMQDRQLERLALTADLRQALVKGELVMHYQPLVSIPNGDVKGYEALLRWEHPHRGLISPATFIPLAEESGLIIQIGEWVLRTALEELSFWPSQLSVAVNLSPIQIRSEHFMAMLINALAYSGVDPGRLELEITESVLLHDSEENVAKLHKIRDLGVRISLDDFGTGYSSLNYLRCFPFDKIKIDRSFVEGLRDRDDCQAIVIAVINLADNLNMEVIAEGIETQIQLAKLHKFGCKQGQGYLFGKAVSAQSLGYSNKSKLKAIIPFAYVSQAVALC